DEIELEGSRLGLCGGRGEREEAERQHEASQPFWPGRGLPRPPIDGSVHCGQIKRPCRLPFVPGDDERMCWYDIRISILMVNPRLLKPKCGNTVATIWFKSARFILGKPTV